MTTPIFYRKSWLRKAWERFQTYPFDRLSVRADHWIYNWNRTNPARANRAYPHFTFALNWATEHPLAFLLPLLLGVLLFAVPHATGWPTLPGLHRSAVAGGPEKQLARLETLWTIQATMVAVVYPIVLAFVTLFLQRRASAKASLQVYMVETGAMVAGMSAAFLVLAIAVGYLVILAAGDDWVQPVLTLSAPWFVLNSVLTAYFLFHTLRYLNEDARLQAFERYAVYVSLPREIRQYLNTLILHDAQRLGLLPGRSSWDDLFSSAEEQAKSDPRIDMLGLGSGGSPCVPLHSRRQREVRDLRLRPLRWGMRLWIWLVIRERWKKKARRWVAQKWPSLFPATEGTERGFVEELPQAVLRLQVGPGFRITGARMLCTVQNAPEPGWLSRRLIAYAFVLGEPPRPGTYYPPVALLRELIEDLIDVTPKGSYAAIRERLLMVTHVHLALLDAGASLDDDRKRRNAALVANPNGLPGRRPSADWINEYNEWLQEAVERMDENTYGFQQARFLTSAMIREVSPDPLRVPVELLGLHRSLIHYLHSWKRKRTRQPECSETLAGQTVWLSERHRWLFDRAVDEAIGAWHQCDRLDQPETRSENAEGTWAAASLKARFVRKHLEFTVEMIFDALSAGDTLGAKGLTDSFLAWPQRSDYRLGGYSRMRHRMPFTMTAAALDETWGSVRDAIAVAEADESPERIEELCGELLLRYWFDLRFVLVLLMIGQVRSFDSKKPAQEIAMALLRGPAEDWKGINAGIDFSQPDRLLLQLMRLCHARFGYRARLDRVCEYVFTRAAGRDSEYPDFSRGFTDLTALKRPLLILFFALAPEGPFTAAAVEAYLTKPEVIFDAGTRYGLSDGGSLLDAWKHALRHKGAPLRRDVSVVRAIRREIHRSPWNPEARYWVEAVLQWMNALSERLTWGQLEIIEDADGLGED